MCRLSLINREGIKYIEKNFKGGIKTLFDHLETSFGGHGNGVAIIGRGKTTIRKGVDLDNKEIADLVHNTMDNINYIIYHTRVASKGVIIDANCHPFMDDNSKDILAMNGTEEWINPLIDGIGTDTEAILKTISMLKFNLIDKVSKMDSVFVGRYKGITFASKGRGDLEVLLYGKGKIFASEFPNGWYKEGRIYNAPKLWIEGEKIDRKKLSVVKKKKKKYSSIGYSYIPLKYNMPWNNKKDYSIYDDV